jgi:hypothetical protein
MGTHMGRFIKKHNNINGAYHLLIGLANGVYTHFQKYFSYIVEVSYIVAVSFIGGGNRSTRRKLPTCCKSLTNLIT